MPDNPNSRITRVRHGARETATHVMDSDEFATWQTSDGFLILELFRKDARGNIAESYRFELCPEDAEHIHRETTDYKRRVARALPG